MADLLDSAVLSAARSDEARPRRPPTRTDALPRSGRSLSPSPNRSCLGRARGGGAAGVTHPDVAKGGPFEAGRARFRDKPEAPTVAASGTAGGRANPDRKVRSGACPALQARPLAAARHWAPGAARRRGPGRTPPAQPWPRPRAQQRVGGRGRLGSLWRGR